jgi:hypothetical protein
MKGRHRSTVERSRASTARFASTVDATEPPKLLASLALRISDASSHHRRSFRTRRGRARVSTRVSVVVTDFSWRNDRSASRSKPPSSIPTSPPSISPHSRTVAFAASTPQNLDSPPFSGIELAAGGESPHSILTSMHRLRRNSFPT